ncbi:ribonuclease [Qipengyuania marisflavi]|uniref:Ribonuclease n=1 Tax=Qipengyuania marisflavi TaxID=2486356 RepID=A0A5S3P6V3_9SPHN|nr:ribonuclease [Qipengyuania marisflavi]TMM48910.1 ribonuclease [Qipengyuania marisflavi]
MPEPSGPQWLVEEGIGEDRAILLDGGEIAVARLHWPGGLTAGQISDAKLISRRKGALRGIAEFAGGERANIDRLPPSASEGASLRIEITRARIWEAGRQKLAQGRPSDAELRGPLSLADQLRADGATVRIVRRFPDEADWAELWREADSKRAEFPGGALLLYPTPAMLLIDVDGEDSPERLALAAVPPLAKALQRFDIGGNVGIDFPTLTTRESRKAVDRALADSLDNWPHERTAINGFGFVQLVARLQRPSLLAHIVHNRAGAYARALLREAERLDHPGVIQLNCGPEIASAIQEDWLIQLKRRTGWPVLVKIDHERLEYEACFAQIVPHD